MDLDNPFPPRRRTLAVLVVAFAAFASLCDPAAAEPQIPTVAAALSSTAASRDAAARITELGLENIRIDSLASPARVGFENRRYRHSAEVLGLLERALGVPVVGFEQRYGLTAAAIEPPRHPDGSFRVRYPSDFDFPQPPRARRGKPTSRTVDIEVGPLIAYEFGRLQTPLQTRVQIEPRIIYNPWAGGRLLATVLIPVHNDFTVGSMHPDIERFRPGLVTFDQYAWIPKVALTSASAGLFADNRYGISLGAARPIAEGALLLDAQVDYTGFIAFLEDGVRYSNLETWTGFAGLTWRPPFWDVALRAQVSKYLFNDEGAEFRMTRTLGEVDFAIFNQRGFSDDYDLKGVRVTVPIPPMKRPAQQAVRLLPVQRFPFSYRTDATPVATPIVGVASREEFLRQLSEPALEANRYRYDEKKDGLAHDNFRGPIQRVNYTGVTGFINTPWAGVIEDRGIELGWNRIPSKWAYDGRPEHANEVYYSTLGLFPRTEVSLRFTRIPGLQGGILDEDNVITTDTDHMASVRLALLTPGLGRPGLAIGVEDIEGTKRYHSSYAVLGLPLEIFHVQNRISLGYAPHVFTAARHVLDGFFGAVEVSLWRAVAVQVEHDTEKWNMGIGVGFDFGLRLRAAALDLENMSVGVGWYHKL